jgi:hypothetical protein
MDKVRGGTPKSSEAMCLNCRQAHIIRGSDLQNRVYCNAGGYGPRIVTFPVIECSVFDDKRYASRYDMESIAWVVHSRNRGPMGFSEGAGMQISIDPPDPDKNRPAQPSVPLPPVGRKEG